MSASIRRDEAWLANHLAKRGRAAPILPRAIADTVKRVRPRKDREPNKLETEFAGWLELRKRDGHIKDYGFERVTLKLAHACRYTPDYDVVSPHSRIEFYEVKGHHTWEDSWVKLKVAAAQYPHFRFHLCKKGIGGDWVIREVPRPTTGQDMLERLLP